jgi:hypothetical protein
LREHVGKGGHRDALTLEVRRRSANGSKELCSQ